MYLLCFAHVGRHGVITAGQGGHAGWCSCLWVVWKCDVNPLATPVLLSSSPHARVWAAAGSPLQLQLQLQHLGL